jgi:hypothetical protein
MTNALLVLGLWAILGAAVAVTVNILQARARRTRLQRARRCLSCSAREAVPRRADLTLM